MTTEEHYINRDYPTLDKFDRKTPKFDYYDLMDFAESYHQAKLKSFGIGDVVGQSEQFICYKKDFENKPKCSSQCQKCEKYEYRNKRN